MFVFCFSRKTANKKTGSLDPNRLFLQHTINMRWCEPSKTMCFTVFAKNDFSMFNFCNTLHLKLKKWSEHVDFSLDLSYETPLSKVGAPSTQYATFFRLFATSHAKSLLSWPRAHFCNTSHSKSNFCVSCDVRFTKLQRNACKKMWTLPCVFVLCYKLL